MKTSLALIYWIPRILCILSILFVSMFALDAFEPGRTWLQQLGDFGMHLIPSIILAAFLVFAWKWELVGGICFIILGLALSVMVFNMNYHHNHSFWMSLGIIAMITFPFILTGILFIWSYLVKAKEYRKGERKQG